MIKLTGLDQLTRQLDQAQRALVGLDGELGTVTFDPTDPGSIETAIQEIETMIDTRLGEWADNPLVAQISDGLKAQYRESILDRAAEARLENSP